MSVVSDDGLDPQIKIELEQLNTSSEEINSLEKDLDNARQKFRQTLSESSCNLAEKAKQNKRSIRKAKAFYEAREINNKAQKRAQEAAHQYHRAVDIYNAAKETISCAESASVHHAGERKREFDSALQELLNHATIKLNEAEEEKRVSHIEHESTSQHYVNTKQKVEFLAKKFKSSIAKSRSYYETNAIFHSQLKDLKASVDDIQMKLSQVKLKYSDALKHLETISESIHEKRQLQSIILQQRRGPGVGAECSSEYSDDVHADLVLDDNKYSEVDSLQDNEKPLTLTTTSSVSSSRPISGCSEMAASSSSRSSMRAHNGDVVDEEGMFGVDRDVTHVVRKRAVDNESSPMDESFTNRTETDEIDCVSRKQTQERRQECDGTKSDDTNCNKKGDFEHSESSGFVEESSSEDDSDINIDDLLQDNDIILDLPKSEPNGRKSLRKLIPDATDEMWL